MTTTREPTDRGAASAAARSVVADPAPSLRGLPVAGVDPLALLALLTGTDVADLSDADVVRVATGWQQVMGVAVAAQAAAVAELAARRPASSSFPVDDVACALSTTTHTAAALVGRAHGLSAHPVLADALRAGVLDARKVDVLLAETERLPHAEADDVLRAVLDDALGLTAPMLRHEARRLVAAIDPDAAVKRAARARTERCVRLDHAGDAMAWVSALLPAADAVAVYSVVDTLARAAEFEGDVRTLPQRRADALADVFATILATGTTPDGRRVPTRQGEPLSLQLTMAASTLAGADGLPGELAGFGPVPASVARGLARAASSFRAVLTDDAGHVLALGTRTHPTSSLGPPDPTAARTGHGSGDCEPRAVPRIGYRPDPALVRLVLARDGTCRFPGCRQPAAVCDLDHIKPFDADRPAADQTCPENVQALCRHHHLAKTHHGWRMRRDPDSGDVVVTSPLGLEYVRPAATILLTENVCRRVVRTSWAGFGDPSAPTSGETTPGESVPGAPPSSDASSPDATPARGDAAAPGTDDLPPF